MKRILHRPETLNVEAFAHDAAELAGTRALAEFPRLLESTVSPPEGGDQIAWRARGESRPARTGPPQSWLHLEGHGAVDLACQRCLEPVRWQLDTERTYLFVEGEEAAAALDAESEHDILALVPRLDIFEVLEDELLLELPLMPRHEVCPIDLSAWTAAQTDDTPAEPQPEPPHPFAGLSVLKRGGTGN